MKNERSDTFHHNYFCFFIDNNYCLLYKLLVYILHKELLFAMYFLHLITKYGQTGTFGPERKNLVSE